jgi:hypothetical protein
MITINTSEFTKKTKLDEWPDLSWIGEYSNSPKEGAIEVGEGPRSYTYFNPANVEYADQDYERMKAYNRGDWYMLGVWAEVEISIPYYGRKLTRFERLRRKDNRPITHWRMETVRSGGLWGIESDSDDDYIDEVYADETHDLIYVLESMGIEVVNDESDSDRGLISRVLATISGWLDDRYSRTMAEISAYSGS